MKKKKENNINYSNREELVVMILMLWNNVPTKEKELKMINYMLMSYRNVDLSSVDALRKMSYEELEGLYVMLDNITKGVI